MKSESELPFPTFPNSSSFPTPAASASRSSSSSSSSSSASPSPSSHPTTTLSSCCQAGLGEAGKAFKRWRPRWREGVGKEQVEKKDHYHDDDDHHDDDHHHDHDHGEEDFKNINIWGSLVLHDNRIRILAGLRYVGNISSLTHYYPYHRHFTRKSVFSVTWRSRSDVTDWLTYLLSQR